MIITNYSPKSQTYFKKPLQNQSSKINFKGGATSVATAPLSTGKVGLILGAGALLFAAIIFIAKKLSIKSKQSTEQKETQKEIKQQLENQSISSASNKKIAMEETKKSIQKLKDETISINDKIEITKQFFKAQGFSNEQIEKALKKAGTTDEEKVANICKWLNEWLTDEEKPKTEKTQAKKEETPAEQNPETPAKNEKPKNNTEEETGVSEVRSSSSGPSMSVASGHSSSSSSSSSSVHSSSYTPSVRSSGGSGIIHITDSILDPIYSTQILKAPTNFTVNPWKPSSADSTTPDSLMTYLRTEHNKSKISTSGAAETFIDLEHDTALKNFVTKFNNNYKTDIKNLKTDISDKNVEKFAKDIHSFIRNWDNGGGTKIGDTSGYQSSFVSSDKSSYDFNTITYPLGVMVENPQLPVCRHRAMLVHAIVLSVLNNNKSLKGKIATGHVTTGGHEYNVLVAKNDKGETFKYKIDAFCSTEPEKATWTESGTLSAPFADELLTSNFYN